MEITTLSEIETRALGTQVAAQINPGDVIALYGELGTGKTVFVQGLLAGFGIDQRVTSPTFVILKIYKTKQQQTIFHLDLYRLDDPAQLQSIGFEEIVRDKRAITIIEWPQKGEALLPPATRAIHFERVGDGERRIYADWIKR